jgi:hypothetical protein
MPGARHQKYTFVARGNQPFASRQIHLPDELPIDSTSPLDHRINWLTNPALATRHFL